MTIIDILRRAGIDVVVASLADSPVTGSHGIRIAADTPLGALAEQDFDMIALPGGMPGADHLKKDPRIAEIVRRLHDAGRPVAAICAAPMVLAAAGVLDGPARDELPRIPEGRRHRRRSSATPSSSTAASSPRAVPARRSISRSRWSRSSPGATRALAIEARPRTRQAGRGVTEAADKSGIAQAPPHMRREHGRARRAREHPEGPRARRLAGAAGRRALRARARRAGGIAAGALCGARGLRALRRRLPLARIPGAGDRRAHRARGRGDGGLHHRGGGEYGRLRRARWPTSTCCRSWWSR